MFKFITEYRDRRRRRQEMERYTERRVREEAERIIAEGFTRIELANARADLRDRERQKRGQEIQKRGQEIRDWHNKQQQGDYGVTRMPSTSE